MTSTLPRLLTQAQVCELLGVSRISLWTWRREGKFPPPLVLGVRSLRWAEPTILRFLESRKSA